MKNCLNNKRKTSSSSLRASSGISAKLRSRLGETLTEVLVSVLIISLATVLFASMIGSASKLNMQAKTADSGVKTTRSSAEAGPWDTGVSATQPATIKVDGHDVKVWFNGGDGLRSYRIDKTEVNP